MGSSFVSFQYLYTFSNAQFYSCTLYCSPCFNYWQNHKTEDKGSHNILSVQIEGPRISEGFKSAFARWSWNTKTWWIYQKYFSHTACHKKIVWIKHHYCSVVNMFLKGNKAHTCLSSIMMHTSLLYLLLVFLIFNIFQNTRTETLVAIFISSLFLKWRNKFLVIFQHPHSLQMF